MTTLYSSLHDVVGALESAGVDYALCGALALAIHGIPRATMDIDLLIRREDLGRAEAAVAKVGFILTAGIIPFNVGKETQSEVARVSKAVGEDLITLDLIIVSPALEPTWATRVRQSALGRDLSVVSREGLIRMKSLSSRLKDKADVEALEELGGDG